MKRSPMELAAIATAAVPGLTPVGVAGIPDDPDDFDSAVIVDGQKNRWRVRSPRHEESSMRLETELTALRSFTPGIRASLPFRLPSVAGTVRQGTLRTFVYNHLPGTVLDLDDLVASGGATAEDIGRAIAAIHALPEELVDRADLPVYTAEEFRQRRLNELDQAATTGRIPPRLLRRWEHALEDVALWRFHPRVVHGDLHEENLLVESGKVAAVTGWTDVRIGDPADDFAWLAAAHEQSFTDSVLESYVAVRGDLADPHIMRRAALAAEFALAQWLSRGIATNDPERIAEGEQMLHDLDADIAEYGGQPISIVEPARMDADGEALVPEEAAPQAGQDAPVNDDAGEAGATAADAAASQGHGAGTPGHDGKNDDAPSAGAWERPGLPPRPATAPGAAGGHDDVADAWEGTDPAAPPDGTAEGRGDTAAAPDAARASGGDDATPSAEDTDATGRDAAGTDTADTADVEDGPVIRGIDVQADAEPAGSDVESEAATSAMPLIVIDPKNGPGQDARS